MIDTILLIFIIALIVLGLYFSTLIMAALATLVQQDSQAVRLRIDVKSDDGRIEEDIMATQLTTTQKLVASITPVDAKGNPAKVQAGSVEWASSDPTVLTVTEQTDENSADVIAVAVGTAQVQVTADADLGDGVVTISGVADVEVIAAQATGFSIALGTPVEQ